MILFIIIFVLLLFFIMGIIVDDWSGKGRGFMKGKGKKFRVVDEKLTEIKNKKKMVLRKVIDGTIVEIWRD